MTVESHHAHGALSDAERERALHRAIEGLREDDPTHSAAKAVSGWQRPVLTVVLAATIGFAIWKPMGTAVTLVGVCTFAYVCTMIDRVAIFRRGLAARPIVVTDEEARAIPDADLPPYTILVPAYNEPEVVANLIGAIGALEYPREKLLLNDPVSSSIQYLLAVPPTGRGVSDALNQRYPTLYETGADVATLALEVPNNGDSQPTWRVYRVNKPVPVPAN